MRSLILNAVLLLSLALPGLSIGQTEECSLPVCNIEATLADLQSMNGDQRGMYAINLKNQYKDEMDEKVLMNLYAFGLEMNELYSQSKNEDWVKRAASDFLNTILFNLSKYSSVNGERLVGYYQKFINQTFRYNLISYFQGKIASLENVKELEEIALFAVGARDHSIAVKDEDWVPRAATALLSEITIKLTHLDPAHEGLYDVSLDEASLALGTLPFDRIAVLDSSSNKNLLVAFINSRLRVTVYSYSHAEIVGNTVSGVFLSTGDIATKFSFNFNRSTGRIDGKIESTKNDTIAFSGKQVFSTRSVFAGELPYVIAEKDILGTMSGEMAGVKGKLSVRSFKAGVYSATFTSENGSILLNFQGKFFAKNGVLSLTSNDKVKLILSLRESNSEVTWSGKSFSTLTGTSSTASFRPLK
jgi:hypothetical protein